MGFGFGSRDPRARALRVGLLVAFVALAALARGHGGRSGLHLASYAAILGLLLLRFVARSRRRRALGGQGGRWGSGARPPMGGYGPGGPFFGPSDGDASAPFEEVPRAAAADRARTGDGGAAAADRWPPPDPGVVPIDPPIGPPPRRTDA